MNLHAQQSFESGAIRVGIGGWTFAPWRGVFYPDNLPQKRELEFASRALTTIEINGTFYSTFKPAIWRKWHDETPDDFVFSVKASRFCTNRKVLADAGDSIKRFMSQGLTQLGRKLGPINWQFMPTKLFDIDDFAAFLRLLPKQQDGLVLRHAVEVRHPSFASERCYELTAEHGVAIVDAQGKEYPQIDQASADFTYARLMVTREELENGTSDNELKKLAQFAHTRAKRGDVFIYFISAAKQRNPAAAQALIHLL